MKRRRETENNTGKQEPCNSKTMRIPRQRRQQQLSSISLLCFLFFGSSSTGHAVDLDCDLIKQWSDGDSILTSSEYATAISGMTPGALDSDFDHLPLTLREPYTRWAQRPCSDDDSLLYSINSDRCIDLLSRDSLEGFCQEIGSILDKTFAQPPSPTQLPNAPTKYPSTPSRVPTWRTNMKYSPHLSSLTTITLEGDEERHRNLQTLQQCYIYMSIGDTNRNNILTNIEYVTFLNRLSDNKFADLEFDGLPQRFQDYFAEVTGDGGIDVSGSKPGQTPSTTQAEFLTGFCDDSKQLLLATDAPAPQPVGPPTDSTANCEGTIGKQQCYISMSIADRDRDSLLLESEYVRFVNRLSNSEYEGAVFDDLPENIRANFFNLASDGSINVNGSKPGQSLDQSQEDFLARVCCETDLAIQTPSAPTTSPPPGGDPGGDPTAAPDGPDCDGTISRQRCNIFLSIADLSKDDFINEIEYVRFLDRLSGTDAYSGLAFDELPAGLIANFDKFAGVVGQIEIFGAKPGQTPSQAQDEFINALCCETDILVQAPLTPSPTTEPGTTSSPTITPEIPTSEPSSTPTIPGSECRDLLRETDFELDDYLNQNEFVRFANRLADNAFENFAFNDLPCPLPKTYESLTDDTGKIPIIGATSDIANVAQQQFVLDVCSEVAKAIVIANQGTGECSTVPTSAPATDPPTVAPALPVDGELEIFNAFIIGNTVGITAGELGSGTANRNGLDGAYDAFAKDSVEKVIQGSLVSPLLLRRRKLEVSFVAESSAIYRIVDSECPGSIEDQVCQIGYAKFVIDVQNENAIDIIEQYTNATQNDINSGLLQIALTQEDPNSALEIINASFPVTDSNDAPTPAPVTEAPTSSTPPEPAEESSSNAGAIVGGLFGTIFICLFFVFIGWYTKRRDKAKNAKKTGDEDDENSMGDGEEKGEGNIVGPSSSQELSFTNFFDNIKSRFGGSKRKAVNSEEDDGAGMKDDDDSDHDDNAFGAFGAETNNTFGEQDGKPGKKEKKNKFGFGKKNKQEEEPGAEGLETVFSSDGSKQEDNFGNYEFEDPSSAENVKDDDEEEAVSKEDLFNSNMSPGWGTSQTGFGTSWGAGGSNDLGGDLHVSKTVTTDDTNLDGDQEEEEDEDEDSQSSNETSEDSTYESNNDERQFPSDSFSGSSNAMDDESSADNDSAPEAEEVGGLDWERNAQTTNGVKADEADEDEESNPEDDSYDGSSQSDSEGMTASTATSNSEERTKRAESRAKVEALVRLVMPDESNKIDEMMDQFRGRESELVSTLQNMQERSATQRARAAVHKSKTRPTRQETRAGGSYAGADKIVGGASEGSAAGTAAIAAASLPIPTGGFEGGVPKGDGGAPQGDNGGNDDLIGFGDQDAFGSSKDGSVYSDERSDDRSDERSDEEGDSFYSDDKDGSFASGDDPSNPEGSYYSGDDPGSRDDEGRSFDDRSGEGSHDDESRSFDDRSGESGSYTEGSRTEGSRTKGSQSQESRSRTESFDDEGQSFDDEGQSFDDQSGSYDSQEESEFEEDSFGEEVVHNDESSEGRGDDESEDSVSQEKQPSFGWN
jgi:hypothetical protein